jgi:hypothetical protein
MNDQTTKAMYFIGWDVGAWNCDRNPRSRDAIVILDSQLAVVGTPWRANLRTAICEATTAKEWVRKLFELCDAGFPVEACNVTIAIDTPLGFSEEFLSLATSLRACTESIGESNTNRYLFRQTERFLFQKGLTPMSALKDMIGSQATKGMHALARFASQSSACGVWTDGELLTAIEAYPAACKGSAIIRELRNHAPLGHEDKEDALTCALVAYLHAIKPDTLVPPCQQTPPKEGWIWFPKDVLPSDKDCHA